MGSSLERYTGAYIKIKKKIEIKQFPFKSCGNKTCKDYSKDVYETTKFCSTCGKKIETLYKNEEYSKGWYDVIQNFSHLEQSFTDISDLMYSDVTKHYMFLIPNERKYVPKNWSFDTSGDADQLFDFNAEFIQKDKTDLIRLAENILLILDKEFGKENVSVHWGILQHYS